MGLQACLQLFWVGGCDREMGSERSGSKQRGAVGADGSHGVGGVTESRRGEAGPPNPQSVLLPGEAGNKKGAPRKGSGRLVSGARDLGF